MPNMTTFSTLILFLVLGVVVALRRLVRGRRRAGWSWREETVFELLRFVTRRAERHPIERLQARLARIRVPMRALRHVRRERVDAGGVPAVWIAPAAAEPAPRGLPIILYLHGGGYVCCSTETHASLMAALALSAPARVLGLDYRLAPAHPYPAALEDALAAYRWLINLGEDPARIVFAGDSAGGGLALAALLEARDRGLPLPGAAVLLSPWVDLVAEDASVQENAAFDYVGGRDLLAACRRATFGERAAGDPVLTFTGRDLRGLPPLLIQLGGAEVLRDQGQRLAEQARQAGVSVSLEVWVDMVHVFQAFTALVPTAHRAIAAIGAFIRAALAGGLRQGQRASSEALAKAG
jgi:epsilon-lactone hydrolase